MFLNTLFFAFPDVHFKKILIEQEYEVLYQKHQVHTYHSVKKMFSCPEVFLGTDFTMFDVKKIVLKNPKLF